MGFVFALVTENCADAERDGSQKSTEQPHASILVGAESEPTHGVHCSLPDFACVVASGRPEQRCQAGTTRACRRARPPNGGGFLSVDDGEPASEPRVAAPGARRDVLPCGEAGLPADRLTR